MEGSKRPVKIGALGRLAGRSALKVSHSNELRRRALARDPSRVGRPAALRGPRQVQIRQLRHADAKSPDFAASRVSSLVFERQRDAGAKCGDFSVFHLHVHLRHFGDPQVA